MSAMGEACGPACRYRQMYEGSQQSLSDMAARQAQAVDRLGRLRAALVSSLKRRFPREVVAVESALGGRLSGLGDEELVAQVDAMISGVRGRGDARLREALEAAGLPVPESDDLSAWAEALAGRLSAAERAPSELSQLFSGEDDLSLLFGGLEVRADGDARAAAVPADAGASREVSAADGPVDGPVDGRSVPENPVTLRPEVAPRRSGRGGRGKKPAVSAARPLPLQHPPASSASAPEVDGEGVGEFTSDLWVPPDMSKALLAGVCIPRPVFAADLVGTAGSMERVAQWEEQCRKENAPVRIVPAKMRHARRGSLIFPVGEAREMAGEFGRSVWGDVLGSKHRSYRGSRLYELAVLLHRVAEQVVSHRLDPHTATFRLSQPGGLTGVVVFFGGDLDEDDVREELLKRVGELVGERLAGVAVVTTNGDATSFERLIETVAQAGKERGWAPTMPVVGSFSWEYADTRGSTAKLILGA